MIIAYVNWYAENEEFKTWEFVTKDDIESPEGYETDLFRLFQHKDTGIIEIYVANSEDYYIHEEMLINNSELLLSTLETIKTEDMSEEFNEWYYNEDEEDEE